MGAVSLQEDTVERYFESNSGLGESLPLAGAVAVSRPVLKYCPLCVQGYLEESSLDRHVATEHGKQYVYLKVNDRIVRDVCWVNRSMDKCDLVVLGLSAIDVEVTWAGNKRRFSVKPSAPSLMDYIPEGAKENVIRISAISPHQSHFFEVYLGRQPTFRPERIDQGLADLLVTLATGSKTDLTGFRSGCSTDNLNELERRYLDGVLEYCHGWRLEEDGNMALARDRLEASMNRLIPFRTLLADDIRCALALRMNIFGGEWGCDDASPFRQAEAFFCCDDTDCGNAMRRQSIVPVASFSARILNAVESYYAKDEPALFTILEELQPMTRNDEDKVAILKARTRRNIRDRQGASAAYERLLDHPIFGDEAKRAVGR